MRKSMIGYEALVEAAVVCGCLEICGQRGTSPEELINSAGVWMPRVGGAVRLPESESSAIEFMCRAALEGKRVLLATSGIEGSILLRGLTLLAAAEIPCVLAYTPRPSWICALQGREDSLRILKGDGNEGYRYIVLAPGSVQEILDLTIRAFDLADRYSNPVVIVIDEELGQCSEPVRFPEALHIDPARPQAHQTRIRRRLRNSFPFEQTVVETKSERFDRKYQEIESLECRWEEYGGDAANSLAVAYGSTSGPVRSAVDLARNRGIRAGMFRPVSLYPFPSRRLNELSKQSSSILVVELGQGQLLRTVQSSIETWIPLCHISTGGGVPPTASDVLAVLGRSVIRYAS